MSGLFLCSCLVPLTLIQAFFSQLYYLLLNRLGVALLEVVNTEPLPLKHHSAREANEVTVSLENLSHLSHNALPGSVANSRRRRRN
jgi:hypothetical protein